MFMSLKKLRFTLCFKENDRGCLIIFSGLPGFESSLKRCMSSLHDSLCRREIFSNEKILIRFRIHLRHDLSPKFRMYGLRDGNRAFPHIVGPFASRTERVVATFGFIGPAARKNWRIFNAQPHLNFPCHLYLPCLTRHSRGTLRLSAPR